MGAESPKAASTPTGAVFLSYASEDAEAAERIATALRSAGVEVWFDQSELRGGDAWDQSIRDHIKACALFIPIISANAHSRVEGYFRLEWKLAVDRSHRMAPKQTFLVPVVIDGTRQADDAIPERFRELQWTRLPSGVTQPEFVARIKRLLSPEPPVTARLPASSAPIPLTGRKLPLRGALPVAVAVLVLAGLAYLLVNKPWTSKPATPPATSNMTSSPAPSTTFAPPPHSIAVLPFVNMSGDKEQEYFSDGLTEEILNSLARISELQVSARTSSFSFKGTNADLSTIAHKLNVASVLEGSVRRAGNTIRVTAQLNNAVTGFHLWSQTYDRNLGDVLKLQTEIATAVAGALKITMLGDIAAKIEAGGTRNPAALDTYLRALKLVFWARDANDYRTAIALYTEAIRLDPQYALPFAGRSITQGVYAENLATRTEFRPVLERTLADARAAIRLAPDLAEGHLALARFFQITLDFRQASEEYGRALALAPGNARVARNYGYFAVSMGDFDAAIAAVRRSAVLDPLNPVSHNYLGNVLASARHYEEALAAWDVETSLDPDSESAYSARGLTYYLLGHLDRARESCEAHEAKLDFSIPECLAVTYNKLGRHADAEGVLARLSAAAGDTRAYSYARIYAQWGNRTEALEWLNTAMRVRDPDLIQLKVDPLMDPLRQEPRFKAIERELKFPN
jgi:TolB-like protein